MMEVLQWWSLWVKAPNIWASISSSSEGVWAAAWREWKCYDWELWENTDTDGDAKVCVSSAPDGHEILLNVFLLV